MDEKELQGLHAHASCGHADPTDQLKLIREVWRLREENVRLRECYDALSTLMSDMDNQLVQYEGALKLIATPKRADGTYNRCREACELIARKALSTSGASDGTPYKPEIYGGGDK